MATPGQKLAESFEKLKELQDQSFVGITSDDLSRVHRGRIIRNGFIREVEKGWYIGTPHDDLSGSDGGTICYRCLSFPIN
jgi:hypothetical protein